MRYEYGDNWVEFDPVWTRAEVRGFFDQKEDELFASMRRKITGIHLERLGEDPITVPDDVTVAALETCQYEVAEWLAWAFIRARQDIVDLGNGIGRQLFGSAETKTAE